MTKRVMIIGEEDKDNEIKKFIKENDLCLKVVDVWEYTPRDNNDKEKQGELFYVLPSELKSKRINLVIFATENLVGGIFKDIIPNNIKQYEFFDLEHLSIIYSKSNNVILFGSKDKFGIIEKLIEDNPFLNMKIVFHWEYDPNDKSSFTINELSYELPNELNYLNISTVIFTDDKKNFEILGSDVIHPWIKRYGFDEFVKRVEKKQKSPFREIVNLFRVNRKVEEN